MKLEIHCGVDELLRHLPRKSEIVQITKYNVLKFVVMWNKCVKIAFICSMHVRMSQIDESVLLE